jgi:hypothetical protein
MPKNKLDKLAFDLFKIFAQYESSLKERGYFKVASGQKIIVDWDKFVNEKIGESFLVKLDSKEPSARYILENPPMKQVVNGHGKVVWQEVSNAEKSVQVLFGHISRIRNNLFHGAKFNGSWFDPDRSEILMKHALVVLKHFKDIIDENV